MLGAASRPTVENDSLTEAIREAILRLGADIVGFGDLSGLPHEVRQGLPVGISVALKFPAHVIEGIADLPTQEYCDWYHRLNGLLDGIAQQGAAHIEALGHRAIALTRDGVGMGGSEYRTALPHKTVATRAGIGWIGKSALLVSPQHGSMIRFSSILTDAPLRTATPIDASSCGSCTACAKACPGGAISGKTWALGIDRDEFFDAHKCSRTARDRSKRGFGVEMTICGKCIHACPYTQKALTAH
jgi:epoxyqueuosine reductase QueG